jgi:hypothetical protein
MGLAYDLLLHPHPDNILHTGLTQMQKMWYQCPSLGYIIDHSEVSVVEHGHFTRVVKHEWLPEWHWLIDLQPSRPRRAWRPG